jgi:transcriptional regulator with XRE-family HTH domain
MTQRDLAAAIGAAPSTISRLETDVGREPLAVTVILLARALDVTIDELIHDRRGIGKRRRVAVSRTPKRRPGTS